MQISWTGAVASNSVTIAALQVTVKDDSGTTTITIPNEVDTTPGFPWLRAFIASQVDNYVNNTMGMTMNGSVTVTKA
jgi:hypothetical protein